MQATFAFVMFFVAGSSSFTYRDFRHGFNTSIEEFYNTTEPIWTYQTIVASTIGISCLVDVTANTSLSNIYFDRFFYSNGSRIKQSLRGTLYKDRAGKSWETLIYDHGTLLDREQLFYQSDDNSCGVFTFFQHPDILRFDLRLRNCSLQMGPHKNCSSYFNEYYKHNWLSRLHRKWTKQMLYKPECQNIFNPPDACK
uniref:Putative lipocalin-3 1 n=1 Tax=Amblyomma triste TaxID=251400 RepID=A0A023G9D3_AMBTT